MVDVADALIELAEQDEEEALLAKQAQTAATKPKITFDDLKLLFTAESVDLPGAIASYLNQPEVIPQPKPQGFMSVAELKSGLMNARRKRRKQQRKQASTEVWKRFLAQPSIPERFKLADLIVELDDKNSDAARALILAIAREAPHDVGLWAGIKRVWKRAEKRHDHALWSALTAAIEQSSRGDVSPGTRRYCGKRAWRYVRDLGRGAPELYPTVVVELLRHYTQWGAPVQKAMYARDKWIEDAWKASPEPLLRLLEGAQLDYVAKMAIDLLKKHHAEVIRGLPPARLARLVEKELALGSVHDLFLEAIEKSASLPLAKLREAGLHEASLRLLFSPSQKARAWAVEYARAHAHDLSVDRVVELVERGAPDVQKLGVSLLEPVAASKFELNLLVRLHNIGAATVVAEKKLRERIAMLDEKARIVFMLERVFAQNGLKFAKTYLTERAKAGESWPAEVWLQVLENQKLEWTHSSAAVEGLQLYGNGDPLLVVDAGRLIDIVAKKPDLTQAALGNWFQKAERARGLDVERVKGLVFPSKTRAFALRVLGNRKLVKPLDLGLAWLLALAKRADQDLHRFAYQTLLEHTRPADFAPQSGGGGAGESAGVDRLFAMATGPAEADNIRGFAQTYLRCHHPVLGPHEAQAKQLGLSPQLPREVYTPERVWRSLFDARDDVKRFAAALAKVEFRRWGYQKRLPELTESDSKEIRNIALDAMLLAGDASADPETTLTLDELDAEVIFPLTESTKKSVRDTGMELIRRHYARLGGKERLSWLMQSADREVRLFAVRLLWEKHRPRAVTPKWRPRAHSAGAAKDGVLSFEDAGRFTDADAMRGFLRRVLFALPPGASADGGDDKVRKHVPASVAKRELVEVVRDVAVADAAFAHVVRPVLFEMTGSLARGEWQACLAAVTAIDKVHAHKAAGKNGNGAQA